MAEIFLKIFNMSVSASWLVLAVTALRFFMKKTPKWINLLLWGIVALRLILPFSFESEVSLVPSTETIPPAVLTENSFTVQTGLPPVDNRVNEILSDSYYEGVTVPANNGFDTLSTLGNIWIIGAIALLIYTAISYFNLKRKVGTAILLRDNIYQSENVASPFVLGIVKPKIYIPFNLSDSTANYVIAHENAHIKRRDHWYKPFGFLLLAIHWFNPIMWLGYILLCKDIELACDEKVISKLGTEQRADYSEALLSCSVNRKIIAACPIAFGEVGVKERVKSVLSYKKPAFWLVLIAVLVCAVVAVCFLTDPKTEEEPEEQEEQSFELDAFTEGFEPRIFSFIDLHTEEASCRMNFTDTVPGTKADIARFKEFQESLNPGDIVTLYIESNNGSLDVADGNRVIAEDEARAFLEKFKALEITPVMEDEPHYIPPEVWEPSSENPNYQWGCVIKTANGDIWSTSFWGSDLTLDPNAGFYVRTPEGERLELRCGDDLGLSEELFALALGYLGESPKEQYASDGYVIFKENGKYGLKNPDGEIVASAEYMNINDCLYYFQLINTDGYYMAPAVRSNNNTCVYGSVKKIAYEIYFPGIGMLPGGPYEFADVRDFGDYEYDYGINATKDNTVYSYTVKDGVITKISEEKPKSEELGDYTVFGEYHYNSEYKGLKNSEGKTVIDPTHYRMTLPFEDRALGLQGSPVSVDSTRSFIYELPSGKLLNDDYNTVYYYSFVTGYIGIGTSYGEMAEYFTKHQNGEITPEGAWFIDKNGKALSKRYEYITTDREDRWALMMTGLESLNTVLYCVNSDGSVEEYSVREIIQNGGTPSAKAADDLSYREINKNDKIEVSARHLSEEIVSSVFGKAINGGKIEEADVQHFIVMMSFSGGEGEIYDGLGNPYDKSKLLYTNWAKTDPNGTNRTLSLDKTVCERIAFEVFGLESFTMAGGAIEFRLDSQTGEYYTVGGFSPSFTYASYEHKIAYIDENTVAVRFVLSDVGAHMGDDGWKYIGEGRIVFSIMKNESGEKFLRFKTAEYFPYEEPISP